MSVLRSSVEKRFPKRLGKYILEEMLGHGSMGVVFRATQELIGRKVALKILSLKVASFNEAVTRFFREARTAARLIHPTIVPILDLGEDQGFYFFAMQFMEGHSLKEVIEKELDRFTLYDKIRIFERLAEGLSVAHQEGIIHRDIKPANIFLDLEGSPKILDFGIAKVEEAPGLTQTGIVIGSPPYMSPEQARGEKLDGRSDIFSLGVVMYELLTGRKAFPAKSKREAIIERQRLEKLPKSKLPPPIRSITPKVPPKLEEIVAKCMKPLREERYEKAEHLLQEIRQLKEVFLKEETDLLSRGYFPPYIRYRGRKFRVQHVWLPLWLGVGIALFGLVVALLKKWFG